VTREDLAAVAASLVRVEDKSHHGSGCAVDLPAPEGCTRILTCQHILTAEPFTVSWREGNKKHSSLATVLKSDKESDLALVEVQGKIPCLSIARVTPSLYEELIQAGHPGDLHALVMPVRLQALGKRYAFAGGVVMGGSSGGPLCDHIKEVVAVVHLGEAEDQEHPVHCVGYAVPLRTIRHFLKEFFPKKRGSL
jgi:hypothetical protein